jgi:hypothetical protein
MELPVFISLKNTPQEWVYDIIAAYNGGSYPQFQNTIQKHNQHI